MASSTACCLHQEVISLHFLTITLSLPQLVQQAEIERAEFEALLAQRSMLEQTLNEEIRRHASKEHEIHAFLDYQTKSFERERAEQESRLSDVIKERYKLRAVLRLKGDSSSVHQCLSSNASPSSSPKSNTTTSTPLMPSQGSGPVKHLPPASPSPPPSPHAALASHPSPPSPRLPAVLAGHSPLHDAIGTRGFERQVLHEAVIEAEEVLEKEIQTYDDQLATLQNQLDLSLSTTAQNPDAEEKRKAQIARLLQEIVRVKESLDIVRTLVRPSPRGPVGSWPCWWY